MISIDLAKKLRSRSYHLSRAPATEVVGELVGGGHGILTDFQLG